MATPLRASLLLVAMCSSVAAPSIEGQAGSALEARVDSLLDQPDVVSLLSSLESDFMENVLLLVPNLPAADRDVLAEAAALAFDPAALRTNVARAVAAQLSEADLDVVSEARRSGGSARLQRVVTEYEPGRPFSDFGADLAGLDRARLQLMASLTEARRSSEVALVVDEALRRMTHELLNAVGGDVGDFVPLTDEAFDKAYRDMTLRAALESMYRMEPASDELVRSAIDEHTTDESGRFMDLYIAGVVGAIAAAGRYVALATAPDDDAGASGELTPIDPSEAPLCRVDMCGLLVDWEGGEPEGGTPAYGAPGDLERFVLQTLGSAGYLLSLGPMDGGLTVRLRARSVTIRCEIISGTFNRTCRAVGQVRVDFIGTYPGHENPNGFTVRNRCRANATMGAQGIASLVAARIHYELTTYPGDERRVPSC